VIPPEPEMMLEIAIVPFPPPVKAVVAFRTTPPVPAVMLTDPGPVLVRNGFDPPNVSELAPRAMVRAFELQSLNVKLLTVKLPMSFVKVKADWPERTLNVRAVLVPDVGVAGVHGPADQLAVVPDDGWFHV
jgi:hypothetical protein